MDGLVQFVLLAAGLALVYYVARPRYRFLIRIEADRVRLTHGKVTEAFLADIREVCRDLGVTSGWIGGVRRGRRVVPAFSRRLPPAFRQRIRNLWVLHG